MIIVTGATGQLGAKIVQELLGRMPAHQIGASTRDPTKAEALVKAGVRVRRGDFADPASLRDAFDDASQVLIVSSNADAYGGDTLAQHRGAIDAACDAGARRIVYTSHMGASATSAFRPMHNHAATEAMLASCGVPWTALRNGFYAESGAAIIGNVRDTRAFTAPADGKVSWTAHADLAAAAAAILAEESPFDGPTPALTAPESLDMDDLAELAAELIRAPVERRVAGDDEFRSQAIGRGVPEAYADIQLGLFQAARAGEFAEVSSTLADLIGRTPITMRDVLAAHLQA
jgi:NAD(P)H dehydrogenase (quinone)